MTDEELRQELAALNAGDSKHAGYQSLPDFVSRALRLDFEIDQDWRGDRNRYEVIRQIARPGRTVVDVGANGGFFSLGLSHDLSVPVHAWEPDPRHAAIMRLLVERFSLEVEVHEQGLDLADASSVEGDLILLMNVLHHAGREFDHELVGGPRDVWSYVERYVGALARPGRQMVWQIGYRWGGDRATPIVDVDEPARFLSEQRRALGAGGWDIDAVLYPVREDGVVRFRELDLAAHDALIAGGEDEAGTAARLGILEHPGEFHRRPLLLCSA